MALKPSRLSAPFGRLESGGNSTMRKMVPFRSGSRCTGRFAASALPALLAGERVVSQKSVSASPGNVGAISLTLAAGPSERMIERPCASWPVTTRRIFWIMSGSCDGVAGGDLLAGLLRAGAFGRQAEIEVEPEALLRQPHLL